MTHLAADRTGHGELGVDSEAKWDAPRTLVVDDPHWKQWMAQLESEQQMREGNKPI